MPVAEPRTALVEAASRRNQSFHERGGKKEKNVTVLYRNQFMPV